jgi:hypothetical protein
MWSALVAMLLALLEQTPTWDRASINAAPFVPMPIEVPAEPPTIFLALVGAGILAVYAGVRRWRHQEQPTELRPAVEGSTVRVEPRKREVA